MWHINYSATWISNSSGNSNNTSSTSNSRAK